MQPTNHDHNPGPNKTYDDVRASKAAASRSPISPSPMTMTHPLGATGGGARSPVGSVKSEMHVW
jgi:hypothetical protein